MLRLALFDFDGTLFRSPDQPEWWPYKEWASNPHSLIEPCVPKEPGSSWWNQEVVEAAKKAIADPDTWAVLATGRLDNVFRWRVPELLKQKGLNFDEVHLSPGGGREGTRKFKSELILSLFRQYSFEVLEVWDDSEDLIDHYEKIGKAMKKSVRTHRVSVSSPPVECSKQDFVGKIAKRVVARYMQAKVTHEKELMEFFKKQDKPFKDEKFHQLAEKLGVSPHILEAEAYELLRQRVRKE